MSNVPLEKRTETKFELGLRANALAKYTVRICSNEKNFPKRYRWCLTYKIVENAVELSCNIKRANAIFVKTKTEWNLRRSYQKKAQADMAALVELIEIAKYIFRISGDRMNYWCGLIDGVKVLLKSWMEADEKRYAKI